MNKLQWTLLFSVLLLPCVYAAEEPDIIYIDGRPVYIEGISKPIGQENAEAKQAAAKSGLSAAEREAIRSSVPGDIYRGHVLGTPSAERNTQSGEIYRGTVFGKEAGTGYAGEVLHPKEPAKTKFVYDTSLVRKIKQGDADGVRTLIYTRVDVNERNYAGMTPLTIAAEKENYEVVRLLVEEGAADVNATSSYGITPLIAAAAGGHRQAVELLLKYGADPTAKDDLGKTALIHAMNTNDYKLTEALVKSNNSAVNLTDNAGNTPLIYAALKGHTDNIRSLLKHEANPDYQNPNNGISPLIAATANNHTKAAQALINGKATLDLRDKNGRTALFYASQRGMVPLVRQLIRLGADVSAVDNNGENLLMAAAESQNVQLLKLLTPQYFYIDSTDRTGKTPLMYSTKKGTTSLEWLINQGANLNIKDASGNTALMHAVKNNNNAAALLLLKQDVDLSAVNSENKDVFILAQEIMPNSPVNNILKVKVSSGEVQLSQSQAAAQALAAKEQAVQGKNYLANTAQQQQAAEAREQVLRRQAEQELMQDPEIAALQKKLDEAKARKAQQLQNRAKTR